MAKGLTIASMATSLLILALFLLDLIIKIPFRRAAWGMDVAFVVCALALGYIAWTTYRDIR